MRKKRRENWRERREGEGNGKARRRINEGNKEKRMEGGGLREEEAEETKEKGLREERDENRLSFPLELTSVCPCT